MFEVSATLESPLAISMRRATGYDLETLKHIPAVALRGALAAYYLEAHGPHPDGTFDTSFLRDQVRYEDLRPEGADHWPLSARECKVNSYHPRVDLLIASASGVLPSEECSIEGCGHKRQRPESFRENSQQVFTSHEVRCRRVGHVQIDEALGKAAGGLLHSASVIDAGKKFAGKIKAEAEAELVVREFLGQQLAVYIGRGKTRGQGRVSLSVTEEPDSADKNLAGRLDNLNAKAPKLKIWFTVTLQSPTLVYDSWLLARSYLMASDISTDLADCKLKAWFARSVDVSGWNAKAGLPKSEVTAIAAVRRFCSSAIGVTKYAFPGKLHASRPLSRLRQTRRGRTTRGGLRRVYCVRQVPL